MGILAGRRSETIDELTRVEGPDRGKGYMLVCEIDESTPGEMHQMNVIADLTEEEYLEFARICNQGK